MDGERRNKNSLKGRGGNDIQHKKKRRTNMDVDNNNSSWQFRPLGSRVTLVYRP